MGEHWFDTLNRALVRESRRRSLLGAAALLASLGAPLSAAAKKGKKGKKGNKGKNNGKKKDRKKNKKSKVTPRLCSPDLLTVCDAGSHDPAACADLCDRCQQEGSAFCLVPSGDDDFPRRPTCCDYADECCGGVVGECCTSDRCCEGVGGDPPFCAVPGQYCCRDGLGGSCPYDQTCCGGYCVACEAPGVLNSATCACELPDDACGGTCIGPGLACCDGVCVNTRAPYQEQHCGGCHQPCTGYGRQCCGGTCVDILFNNAQCSSDCLPCPAGWECCHGKCIDTQVNACCRDHPAFVGPHYCRINSPCCTYTNGQPGCCST